MRKLKGYTVFITIILGVLFCFVAKGNPDVQTVAFLSHQKTDPLVRWKEAVFKILTPSYKTFKAAKFNYVFLGHKNSIVKIAPELDGLTGVKLSFAENAPLKTKFAEPAKVLVGVFADSAQKISPNILGDKANAELIIKNAVTITGLPAVNVYTINYSKGVHILNLNSKVPMVILGVVKASQKIQNRDAAMPDGRLWEPMLVEGFTDEKPLFEIVGGPANPVIAEGMPGTEGIQGGFEGGACVKVGNTYHMFPTERAGQKGVPAYFDRVKTRIGHWTSKDAIHWTRQSSIYEASGNYAVTHEDNPVNDRRGAIWSYMPIFNQQANRWYGYYLAYTVDKEVSPNHSYGRIWRAESVKQGLDGIGGPYKDCGIIMEPGLDSQLWEGRQGVDSFYPYKTSNGWLAFYGGAYPYKSKNDYPNKMGKGWYVGIAKSASLDGPWTRLDTTINPVKSIHHWFIENPIVYRLPNGLFITVFDGGPEGFGHHLPNMFGYSLSKDGYHWSEAHYFPIETKVKKWWDMMRTPLCLIPEGNNIYTVLYAAINTSKRFHPIGMVRLKLNKDVADAKLKEPQ